MERTFDFNKATEKAIDDLKAVFGVESRAEVIESALAISRIVKKERDKDNTVTIGRTKLALSK